MMLSQLTFRESESLTKDGAAREESTCCWFALVPRERDEAMMLSQLTFRESESLTKAGAAREEST